MMTTSNARDRRKGVRDKGCGIPNSDARTDDMWDDHDPANPETLQAALEEIQPVCVPIHADVKTPVPAIGYGVLGNFRQELHVSTEFAQRPSRTPYYFNQMAKSFLRWLLQVDWLGSEHSTAAGLARSYRESYRAAKADWARHFNLSTGGAV